MAEQLPLGWEPLRIPRREPLPGCLLIAAPTIEHSPEFDRTVVLMLEHDESGSLGVVLNRPTETSVSEVLPEWSDLAAEGVFRGGPVGTDCALALALVDAQRVGADDEQAASLPDGVRRVSGNWALVNLDRNLDDVQPVLSWMRIFAGYAGWSVGQLDDELDQGAWWVVPAASDDLLRHSPGDLWDEVIRRQPGDLRLAATLAGDPELN